MANLTRTNMRTGIARAASTTVGGNLSSDELNDAISQAVSEMSRHIPEYLVEEIQFEEDVASESVTSSDDTEVALANKPVKKDSEAVKNSAETTTYTRDTDYEMDYINGRIKTIGSGAIPDATTIKVTYKKALYRFQINSLLTRPIKIFAVEHPIDQLPPSYQGFDYFGDFVVIRQNIADEEQIRIWHTATWIDPADSVAGTWPEFIDEIVVLGAIGYALQIEAIQQENAAITELASATTAIAKIDDHATKTGVALDAANTAFDLAATTIELIKGVSTEPLDLALTALAKVAGFATTDMNTALDKVAAFVDTDAETAYNKVSAIIDDTETAMDLVNAELVLANTALDKIDGALETDATNPDSATKQLAIADSLINAQNTGKNVPEIHADFARVQVSIATGWAEEAGGRIAHAAQIIAEAGERIAEADARIREGNTRINQADAFMREAQGRSTQANLHIAEAGGLIAHAQTLVSAAAQYIAQGLGFLSEVSARNDEGRLYSEMGAAYQGNAAQYTITANMLRVEAENRLARFREALIDRATTLRQTSSSAFQQHIPQSATTPHPNMGTGIKP